MGQTPEGKIKAMVKKALASLDPNHYSFMPVQSGFGTTGLDFFLCIRGKFIAVETKADHTKKLRPRQIGVMDQIHLAGGKVFIVYDQATCDTMIATLTLMMEFDPDANDQPSFGRAGNPILQGHFHEIANGKD
jgi:hypothetical protein